MGEIVLMFMNSLFVKLLQYTHVLAMPLSKRVNHNLSLVNEGKKRKRRSSASSM